VKIAARAAAISSALSLIAAARQRDSPTSIFAGEGGITVVAADLGITIEAKVEGNIIVPGAVAVPADRIAALISAFAADAIIQINAEPNGVTIGRYRLQRSVDMPPPPTLTGEIGRIEIDGVSCISLLSVASAAATDESRFVLTGIFLRTVDHWLIAVGTNGTRLIRQGVAAGRFSFERDLIVPTRSAAALARLIRQTKSGRVLLRRSKSMLAASGNGFSFTSRLIDAEYPPYEALIPELTENTVVVDRVDLLAALARLGAVTRGEVPLIALTWTEGTPLHVFLARQPDDGADDIAAETKGRARIALVPQQFAAMLSEFGTKRVQLGAAADRLLITGEDKLAVLVACRWHFQDEVAA
jgi:DNA polymerase-3 subunit beta